MGQVTLWRRLRLSENGNMCGREKVVVYPWLLSRLPIGVDGGLVTLTLQWLLSFSDSFVFVFFVFCFSFFFS